MVRGRRKREVRVRRAVPDYRRMRSRLVTTAYLILILGVVSALLAPLATPGAEMTPEYLIGVILERPPLLSVLALVVTAALSTFLVVKAYAIYLYFRTIDALTKMMEGRVPQPAMPQPTPMATPTPTPTPTAPARVMPARAPVSRETTPVAPSPVVTPRAAPTRPPTPTVPPRQVTPQVQPAQRAVQPSASQPQRVQPQPRPTAPVAQPQPQPAPSVSSKKCPYCGRVLPFGDLHTVCPYCGRRLK